MNTVLRVVSLIQTMSSGQSFRFLILSIIELFFFKLHYPSELAYKKPYSLNF